MHRLTKANERIACGNELMADVAIVTNFHELLHDRWVIDLLAFIQLRPTGIAGGMHMANDVPALLRRYEADFGKPAGRR